MGTEEGVEQMWRLRGKFSDLDDHSFQTQSGTVTQRQIVRLQKITQKNIKIKNKKICGNVWMRRGCTWQMEKILW